MIGDLNWKGLFVAVTTPFSDGLFDAEAFGRHLEHLLAKGTRGIVACGTTGEAATMTRDEKKAVIARAVEVVDGRAPVVAGVGTNSTRATIELAHDALAVGADALLVVTPYYNKPPQDALVAHYRAVAAEAGAPIVIYNVPGRTGVDIKPATIAQLASLPEIVAVKDATANMSVATQILRLCGNQVALMSGDDFTAMPFIAVGGHGCISVVGNVDPGRTGQMLESALAGDFDTARRLHHELMPLVEALFSTTNPIPVKAAVSLLGFGTPEVRLPLISLDSASTQTLSELLHGLELI